MPGFEPLDLRAKRVRLAHGRAVVEVAPGIGGRVASLEVDGWNVLRRDGWTDNEWGVFVMAPWVGRLRDAHVVWGGRTWSVPQTEPPHALHGLVSAVPWTVVSVTARSIRLERSLGPEWPTGGRLVHTIAVGHDRLVMHLELHAEREPTPAILGWHPWFPRRATRVASPGRGGSSPEIIADAYPEAQLEVVARRRVELDGDGLPTGVLLDPRAEPVDDVLLGLTSAPIVRWPAGPTLTLNASGVAAWIAYTAHPDGVCLEPVTGIPDGINGGILGEPPVAAPLAPLSATFEIAWG